MQHYESCLTNQFSECTLHELTSPLLRSLLAASFLQFSLATGIWNWAVAKQELNILVVGLAGSGKTVVMEQLKRKFVKGYRGKLGTKLFVSTCFYCFKAPFLGPNLDAVQTTMGMNLARLPMGSCSVTWWDVGGSVRSWLFCAKRAYLGIETKINRLFAECLLRCRVYGIDTMLMLMVLFLLLMPLT